MHPIHESLAGTVRPGRRVPASSAKASRPAPPTPASNAEIAAALSEIADLLDLTNDNPFRIRAYRNAARTLGGFGRDVAGLLASGEDLPKLPGIGADLAGKIAEIASTGECALLRRLRKRVPAEVVRLLRIPGLGPRRVQQIHRELGVRTPEDLLAAARAGRLRTLPRFGEKLESKLLEAAERQLQQGQRTLLADATAQAERLRTFLCAVPGVEDVTVAGSVRRMRDTVGDIDLVATAAPSSPIMSRFVGHAEVREVLAQGPTRASVVLKSGMQADLRVMDPKARGAALIYFTGSKAHNIAIRRLALQRRLKISEYGVFDGRGRRIAGDTEASVYRALQLPLIPPELREDRGEIDAALQGRLPRLVELGDLRGDLHAHTRATDGLNTLEEMARAAQASGLEYLAITDHSPHLALVHGLDADRLLRQGEEIDRLNAKLKRFTLLKGVEVDILENGELDLPDDVLRQLDVVIVAVHSHFDLPARKQTRRILRALDHPYVTLLAHPNGRLIGQRESLAFDLSTVIAAAARRGCFLELNAQPRRMDLWDIGCRQAKDAGVLVSIDSDAHGTADLAHLRFGIGQARRGWLEAGDVLNTLPLARLRPLLERCFR